MASHLPDPGPGQPDALIKSAEVQDKTAAALSERADELRSAGHLTEAKSLQRASRHRRVQSIKARAVAAAKQIP